MNKKSRIEISDPAIVSLVQEAVTSVKGVQGFKKELLDTISNLFGRSRGGSAIEITSEDDHINLHLHLVLELGSFFPAVVSEVKEKVRKSIEGTTPLRIKDINIYIEDLQVQK